MGQKPGHLRLMHAARFQEEEVANTYHLRPSYPAETFDILLSLMRGQSGAVLDVGAGTGDVARHMAPRVERVDAVDFSRAMIARGKQLPNGDHPHLNWIYSRAEEAPLSPPYALVTAGQSLHWMDWEVVLPRFREALTAAGFLAIVNVEILATCWNDELIKIIRRFSTNPHYKPLDLIKELEERGLYRREGEQRTASVPFTRSLEDYVESFHARSSLSRGGMGQENAAAFDRAVASLVAPFTTEGQVTLEINGHVVWGRPC
ncbi:MAG TPA: class I SAM-dependent methyltransferase [Ktedonobacteraceae bacterium]|nr:class I SAM-dependent methyltransferase [Ktedonobacteraceae bacterium]